MNSSSETQPENYDGTRPPPQSVLQTFRMLGPGLIIAAAIVGSGELIATTKTGADAGMSLLWLILIGCMIKVFAQIEIGRYTLISGLPTLSAMQQVPGPRIRGRGNWLVWYWFIMWFASVGQLGGIVGSVGQATAIILPVTEKGRLYNEMSGKLTQVQVEQAIAKRLNTSENSGARVQELSAEAGLLQASYQQKFGDSKPLDDRIWTVPWAVATSILLWWGRYRVIQTVSTLLVAIFTLVTVGNVVAIQSKPEWALTAQQWIGGLVPHLPEGKESWATFGIAMATLGIIGVGASELVQYPYWLLEKGYARWTGKRDNSPQWIARARGWMRVMQFDAWTSMVIYTVATIAFYVLGAAILHPAGLQLQDSDLIRTLAVMYQPVFSSYAPILFLFGAFAVLYSTFYVANASHARTFADGLVVTGLLEKDPKKISNMVVRLSVLFPLLCCLVYCLHPKPVLLVLLSAMTQAIMLPMLGFAALYFRYRTTVPELRPGKIWDTCLWLSFALLLAVGTYTLFTKGQVLFEFMMTLAKYG